MSRKSADTYTASLTRLKALVAKLEGAQVDVDELEAVVKESVELVTTCRARLRATQASVDTLLVGLQDDATAAPPAKGSAADTKPPALTLSDESDPFSEE